MNKAFNKLWFLSSCLILLVLITGTSYARPLVYYHDVIEAYRDGRHEDGRNLMVQHLNRLGEEGRTFLDTNDKTSRESVSRDILSLTGYVLGAELRLDPIQRFDGDADKMIYLQNKINLSVDLVSYLQGPEAGLTELADYIDKQIGFAARDWIAVGQDLVSDPDIVNFFKGYQKYLTKAGIQSLQEATAYKPAELSRQQVPESLAKSELAAILPVLTDYFEGLRTKNKIWLMAATGLDATRIEQLLSDYDDDLTNEGIDSIVSLDLPDKDDNFNLVKRTDSSNLYDLMIKNINLTVVTNDNTENNMSINKHMSMKKDPNGNWTVFIYR